jgi:26S proteasome regulatory subunit N1
VLEVLIPIVQDSKVGIEVAGFAAMTLGLVYVGSCNEDVAQSIVLPMEHTETELGEPLACFLCLGLGLGLLYLGKQVMWALFCSFLVESFYLVRLYLHN